MPRRRRAAGRRWLAGGPRGPTIARRWPQARVNTQGQLRPMLTRVGAAADLEPSPQASMPVSRCSHERTATPFRCFRQRLSLFDGEVARECPRARPAQPALPPASIAWHDGLPCSLLSAPDSSQELFRWSCAMADKTPRLRPMIDKCSRPPPPKTKGQRDFLLPTGQLQLQRQLQPSPATTASTVRPSESYLHSSARSALAPNDDHQSSLAARLDSTDPDNATEQICSAV